MATIQTVSPSMKVGGLIAALNANFAALNAAIESIDTSGGTGGEGGGTIDPEQLTEIYNSIAAVESSVTTLTTELATLTGTVNDITNSGVVFADLPYSPSIVIDFAGGRDYTYNVVATGAIDFTALNITPGHHRLYYIETGIAPVNLTFPEAWRPMRSKPTQIPANSVAALWFGCRGSTQAAVVYAYDAT